jgi:peptidoglycan/LPS O-acetylase OafA/YrhL
MFYLDVLRGVAVLLVLGHHTTATLRVHPVADALSDALRDMGYLGVDLFFVLSGFLIGGLLLQELDETGTLQVRRFLVRRALKIWPSYLVCLTASCLAYAALDQDLARQPDRYRQLAAAMWPAFFHVQNYAPSTGRFIHLWSLGVEEHFYFLLPPVLLLMYRPGRVISRVLVLVAAVAVVCLSLRGEARLRQPAYDGYVHWFPTHLRVDGLLAGVMLAAVTRYAPAVLRRLRPFRWILAAVGAAFFALPAIVPGWHPKLFPILYPFDPTLAWLSAAAFVLLAHYADESAARAGPATGPVGLSRRLLAPVAAVGFYSYSIYLWHYYFAPPLSKRVLEAFGYQAMGGGTSTLIHLVLYLGVALALGVMSSLIVEQPFLKLRERVCPRTRGPRCQERLRKI